VYHVHFNNVVKYSILYHIGVSFEYCAYVPLFSIISFYVVMLCYVMLCYVVVLSYVMLYHLI
jgi:hypothetical protein